MPFSPSFAIRVICTNRFFSILDPLFALHVCHETGHKEVLPRLKKDRKPDEEMKELQQKLATFSKNKPKVEAHAVIKNKNVKTSIKMPRTSTPVSLTTGNRKIGLREVKSLHNSGNKA